MSKSQEWYTPPFITDAIIKAFGGIDLDPCSNPFKTVPAKRYIIGENGEDGLSDDQEWSGTVFINPPWNNIEPWTIKALSCIDSDVFLLVPNRTETKWFQRLLNMGAIVCLFNKRVNYCKWEDGQLIQKKGIPHGSVLFYLGYNKRMFRKAFKDYGVIL